MVKIHIVGAEHSFTHDACEIRYPKEEEGDTREFIPYEHKELVTALVEAKIPKSEPAIVPLWNSNTGTVEMDKQERTIKLFSRKAGLIHDIWPQQIVFKLAVKDGGIFSESKIFSVKVAWEQCSGFFKKYKIGRNNFVAKGATTIACDAFLREAKPRDGLLCGENLLRDRSLTASDEEVTNLNNFTIFSIFNKLPNSFPGQPRVSLGCISMGLDGDEIPYEFIDYYKGMLDMSEIEQAQDLPLSMPKILFILRYEESKALMLMEMDGGTSGESPWEAPEIESGLDFYDEVGRVFEPLSLKVSDLFKNKFNSGDNCVFYGFGSCYMWVCPALNISVHGYDKKLVQKCAEIQVLHLKSLLDAGIELPNTAVKELNRFAKDPGSLNLAAGCEPDNPKK
jgi:prephenate dehydratase